MTDERRHERSGMVETQLRARGVADERVLAAMAEVPRHWFLDDPSSADAYADRPLPIGERQTISQPYMVASMTELLGLTGAERVLEIGTGSGYQTAILSRLAAEVFTVERIATLSGRARAVLARLPATNVRLRVGDGTAGWPEEAPFDAVLVTAATPGVPPALLDQLADPGVLVAPVGDRIVQDLVRIRRERGRDRRETFFRCVFVPLVGADGFPEDS
jgi:protein-L-isoaspartate(D-aspartate) O-methyltransferase